MLPCYHTNQICRFPGDFSENKSQDILKMPHGMCWVFFVFSGDIGALDFCESSTAGYQSISSTDHLPRASSTELLAHRHHRWRRSSSPTAGPGKVPEETQVTWRLAAWKNENFRRPTLDWRNFGFWAVSSWGMQALAARHNRLLLDLPLQSILVASYQHRSLITNPKGYHLQVSSPMDGGKALSCWFWSRGHARTSVDQSHQSRCRKIGIYGDLMEDLRRGKRKPTSHLILFSPKDFSPTDFSPGVLHPYFSPIYFLPTDGSTIYFSPKRLSPIHFSHTDFSPTDFAPSDFHIYNIYFSSFHPYTFHPGAFTNTFFAHIFFTHALFTHRLRTLRFFTHTRFTCILLTHGFFTHTLFTQRLFTKVLFTLIFFPHILFTNRLCTHMFFTQRLFTYIFHPQTVQPYTFHPQIFHPQTLQQ